MVVEKKFYERIRLFWWVALGVSIYSVLWGLILQICRKVLLNYAEKDIEPSESMVEFMEFLIRHGKLFSFILIVFSLFYYGAMLLLREYSNGMLMAAAAGFLVTAASLAMLLFYWNVYPEPTMKKVLQVVANLAGLALGIFYSLSMMKMTKPFFAKIAKLWEVELWLVLGGFALRLVYAVLLIIIMNKTNTPAFAERIERMRSFYENAKFLYEIVCLGLTVWMFKRKMEKQEHAGGEPQLTEATAE